jgi:hypothetical protein
MPTKTLADLVRGDASEMVSTVYGLLRQIDQEMNGLTRAADYKALASHGGGARLVAVTYAAAKEHLSKSLAVTESEDYYVRLYAKAHAEKTRA